MEMGELEWKIFGRVQERKLKMVDSGVHPGERNWMLEGQMIQMMTLELPPLDTREFPLQMREKCHWSSWFGHGWKNDESFDWNFEVKKGDGWTVVHLQRVTIFSKNRGST